MNPASVTFNNSSGNYVLSGTGNIASGGSLTKSGTGTLTINNGNSYSGGTTVDSGTVIANTATALGAASGALVLGTPATSSVATPTGMLVMNASITAGSFSSTTNNATADLLTINSGFVLTVNGEFDVGATNNNSGAVIYNGALTAGGGGAIAVSGSENFNVAQPSTGGNNKDTTTANFSGLNSVNVNITGTLGVGLGADSKGIFGLADTTVSSNKPVNFISRWRDRYRQFAGGERRGHFDSYTRFGLKHAGRDHHQHRFREDRRRH